MSLWAFMRTWNKDTFHWVARAVTDRFAVDFTHELSVPGSVVAAVSGSASLVAVSGGSHVLTDTYGDYLGSGYSHKLEYPVFDLRLLKRCLKLVLSFGNPPCVLFHGNIRRIFAFSLMTGNVTQPHHTTSANNFSKYTKIGSLNNRLTEPTAS